MMRQVRRLVGGGILALITALATAGTAFAPPPACDLTQLQLRDSTVNQGLGSYDRLVRGKETLVRTHLSMPSCHDNNDQIQITAGSMDVSGAGTTLATGISGTPSPVSTFPTAATYATAPLNDAPADVKFVVPGSALAPVATTDSYTASFTATITFQTKTSAAAPLSAPIQQTFTAFATKTVERRTNALRILVVPMGNASNSYSTEFPAEAVAAVQNGMQTLARMFPVPDGVGTLGGTTGGIRYAIDPTLLNVSTPFCGGSANFATIKPELAQFLVSWNAANPDAQADRVVGAIWSGRSNGSSAGCAEGMASMISPESWVRAIPDADGAASMTGALFAMEIGHTYGLTPAARSFSTFHSLNTAADGTSPNRGYNVASRTFLADDRTVMNFTGTWNNTTTLLEKEDYAFLLCVLGGQTNTECLTSNVAGTAGGVAALPQAFAVTGTTDDTPAGTEAKESFKTGNIQELGIDPNSAYRLVQRAPDDSVVKTDRVRVSFTESVHDHDGGVENAPKGTFAAVVSLIDAATKFELWKGEPAASSSVLLWSTTKTNAPTIKLETSVGGVRNFTNTALMSEREPSLSSDAGWVAYSNGAGVYVAPVDRPQSAVSVPYPVQEGVITRVLYTAGSTIFAANSDGSGVLTVFDGSKAGLIGAQDAEYSPDGTKVVFSSTPEGGTDRDIYTVNFDGTGLRRLTTDDAWDREPTWSRKGRIVFSRGPQGGGPEMELYSIWPDGTDERRLTNNSWFDGEPAASPDGNQIAWFSVPSGDGLGIYRMNIEGGEPAFVGRGPGNSFEPEWSPDGTKIAFTVFGFPFTQTDVFVVGLDGGEPFNVTNTSEAGVSERDPQWSGDGNQLLLSTGTGMAVIPWHGDGEQTPVGVAGGDDWGIALPSVSGPAWGTSTGDKGKLAYVMGGDIYTLSVNIAGARPIFGDPVKVYDHVIRERPFASHPTWSRDETQIAFAERGTAIADDIVLLDLRSGNLTNLTDDLGASSPSWSRAPDTNVIAFQAPSASGGPQIRTVNPTDPEADPPVLIESGNEPSWGTDGRLAFSRNGEIWTFEFGDPSFEKKAFDGGFDPSLAGDTFAFVREAESEETDVMIGSPGSGITADVDVADDNADENKLDLLVACDGLVHVAAVARDPDQASEASASWQLNFDPSLTCANPTLTVAVSDGYNRVVTATGEQVQADQKVPTAAIYTPSPGEEFDQYDGISVNVAGHDAEDGVLAPGQLHTELTGQGFSASGTGDTVDFSPPVNGFPLGVYELKLTVTDSAGNSDTESRTLTIVGDADNDGLTDDEELLFCITFNPEFGSASQDPLNAFIDSDLDGNVNVNDAAVCTAASEYEATVKSNPDAMELGSNGVITFEVTIPNRDMKDVSTAFVKSINGIDVSDEAAFRAQQWNVARGTNTGLAKIDRTPLNGFFMEHGIANQSVRIVIAGVGGNGSWSFEGVAMLGVK